MNVTKSHGSINCIWLPISVELFYVLLFGYGHIMKLIFFCTTAAFNAPLRVDSLYFQHNT